VRCYEITRQSALMGRRSETHVEGWRLPAMPAQEEVAGGVVMIAAGGASFG
jgi:hypothetical protein